MNLSGHPKWFHEAKAALVLALLYAAADILLHRCVLKDGWTILWPLNGATIALLLIRPRSAWPATLCGVGVGTGAAQVIDHHDALGFELSQRAISLVEVLISAICLPAFTTLEAWLRQRHLYRRFVAALLLGPGTGGLLAAILFHAVVGQPYLLAFNHWGTADALGIAATIPFCLSLRSAEMRRLFQGSALPKTLLVLTIALAGATLSLSVTRYPLLFLFYPLLLGVDFLLGFVGSAIAILADCLIAIYLVIHFRGPFGMWPAHLPISRDAALQLFLGFHVVALFPLSLLMQERKKTAQELQEANVQLTLLASLDGLTGIPNRRALDERLAQEWNRAIRVQRPIALLMIDVDHFKQFNDHYGHQAGDQTLTSVARALAARLHRPDDLIARFGGEEFAVLLPQTDLTGAAHVAEQLRSAAMDLAIPHSASSWGCVTISIGCAAAYPLPSKQTPTGNQYRLLKSADEALYQAKQAGRNCVEAGFLPQPMQ